jgi:ribosome-binding factor A
MSAGSRPSRIGDQLRVELSDLISREVHDPGIGFLTITHVKVTPDLQTARVYYTTLGDDKARRDSRRALDRATPFLRRQIGSRLRLKRVPQLEFFFDDSIERGDRIERILQEINAARTLAEGQTAGSGTVEDDDIRPEDTDRDARGSSRDEPTERNEPDEDE